MTNPLPPAPYPANVRAKGWRFELDHERIRQSDTWVLTPAAMRPWLLMLWMTAWEQTPCGSLPSSDELIAARLEMPLDTFKANRACLLRGWWQADDGRLYHNTLSERVTEMLTHKDKERTRKAEYRRKQEAGRAAPPAPSPGSPDLSHGTSAGQPPDDRWIDTGRDDTGTGTGTLNTVNSTHAMPNLARAPGFEPAVARASPEAAVCIAMRTQGMGDVNPSHPEVKTLLSAGADLAMFLNAARQAVERHKGFAYALGIVRSQLADATRMAQAAAAAPPARAATRGGQAPSFRERDAAAKKKRWEEMHGRTWPDDEGDALQHGNVIDITPNRTTLEIPHGSAS